jgi:hypothetical protein
MTTPSEIRQTRTTVELAIPRTAWEFISKALREAGYDHAFHSEGELIDMHGISVSPDASLDLQSIAIPPRPDELDAEVPWNGDTLIHHTGNLYTVLQVANIHTNRPGFPLTIVYQSRETGRVYAREWRIVKDKFRWAKT